MSEIIRAYGCQAKDDKKRMNSSSGGIFSVFAEKIIKGEGVVYGTKMADDCKSACFIRVDKLDDICVLQGSKYLQSNVGDTFKNVKSDLESGIIVLFSGCPCQINGLKLFLGKEYENLICMDIICHGVPSPKLWRIYADSFEKKYNATLKGVNFRAKNKNWERFGLEQSTTEKNIYEDRTDNSYMQFFLKNYCLRLSCYDCKAKKSRASDITIGDFWGIDAVLPEMNDGKGSSLVIVRSAKGMELLENIAECIRMRECEYSAAIKKNSAELKSVAMPPQRDSILKDMNTMEFSELECKYLGSHMVRTLKKIKRKIYGGGVKQETDTKYGLCLRIMYKNGLGTVDKM